MRGALVVLVTIAGCADGRSVVTVSVEGAIAGGVERLEVGIEDLTHTQGRSAQPIEVVPAGHPVALPPAQLISLGFPSDVHGRVTISVTALDAMAKSLGSGRADVWVEPSNTTQVTVTLGASSASGAWTLIQRKEVSDGNTLSLSPISAGSLIVVAAGGAPTGITDDANNTYVSLPEATGCIDIFYAKNANAGATKLTALDNMVGKAFMAWEVSGIDPSAPFDVAASLPSQPASTTPMGAAVTTTAAGDFILSVLRTGGGVTGIYAGNEFTNDSTLQGNGWAHLTDNHAPAGVHQARWNTTSGGYCGGTVAFKAAP